MQYKLEKEWSSAVRDYRKYKAVREETPSHRKGLGVHSKLEFLLNSVGT